METCLARIKNYRINKLIFIQGGMRKSCKNNEGNIRLRKHIIMKQTMALIALALLILVGLNCGSTEDPIDKIDEVQLESGKLQVQVEEIEGVTIHVRLLKDGQLIAQADSVGNYDLGEIEKGEYTVEISAKGYETTEHKVNIVAGETYVLDKITLLPLEEPVGHLNGQLTDEETGNPLSNVLIKLTETSGQEYETLTSDDGNFTFENLPADNAFTLSVTHTCYEMYDQTVDAIEADETFEIDVKLTSMIRENVDLDPGNGLIDCSQAPEFELSDSNNQVRSLDEFIGDTKLVIVFYRGGW